MAAIQDPRVSSEIQQSDLGKTVESVVSSGDVSGIADVCLRLLRELETTSDSVSVTVLLKRLFEDKQPSTVAIFLHVFAATDALQSSKAVQSLRDLAIDPAALLEYLCPERLVELGLVDATLARKRYQRIIGLETRTLTFDLHRDCPYGYAELATLLTDAAALNDELWRKVLELVGKYTLEPFRVLCMVIDLVVIDDEELNSESLEWLAKSDWRAHPDLPTVIDMFLDEPTGVQLAARLTVLGAVSFAQMFAFIDPKPQGFAEYQRQIKQEQEDATQSGTNALAMSEMLDDDDDEEDYVMNEESQNSEALDTHDTGIDTRPSEEPSDSGHTDKMQTALLYLGEIFSYTDHDHSNDAVNAALSYVNAYPLIAGSSDAIAKGLSNMVCRLLESEPPSHTSLLTLASKYLVHVCHNLSEEVWYAINKYAVVDFDEFPDFWTDFFREYMLPSLDFEPTNDSILWRFDEQRRFELYNDLQTRVAKENFFVKTRFAKADKETKNILKRLTKSDAQEKIVPALLEVFGQCPLPSLAAFVNQVESYNIGSLVARSTSTHIPDLAMDMLPLIIMQQLTTGGRLAQQQDGLYESRWFRLLAAFAGEIASQHAEFDFLSLITLVLRQINEGDYTQIVVLEQLLLRLSGIPLKSNMSIPQIVALCSAPTVRDMTQAALTEQIHSNRERLISSLQQHDILLDVFVALCHVYNHMLLEGSNAKVVVNRRDLVAELVVVYADLIGGSGPFDIADLCTKHAVPLPFAMILWRNSTKELGNVELVQTLPSSEEWKNKIADDLYFNFWHMSTYDIVFDEKLYITVGEMHDPKVVEKSSLSHKLRTKSIKQKLVSIKDSWFTAPTGEWNAGAIVNFLIIPRLVVSPVDAVYASRFLQVLHEIEPNGFNFSDVGDALFSRGVILALLNTASPLELESFAIFTTDLFEYVLRLGYVVPAHKNWLNVLTKTLLEVAVPTQGYIPMSNVFSFLQKTSFVFPMFSSQGQELLRRIQILTVSLTDGDLETSVKSLYAQLTKRKPLWIEAADTDDVHATGFYESMVLNTERLESRLLTSLRALSDREHVEEKPEPEAKRPRRRGNDRRDRKNGGKRSDDDHDLLSGIGKKDSRSELRQLPTKRFDDDRPQKGWGSRRERGRRRR